MEDYGFLLGCYIYPDHTSTINHVFPAIGQFPHAVALLVAGYFNYELVAPEGNRSREEILASIVIAVLENISVHFLP